MQMIRDENALEAHTAKSIAATPVVTATVAAGDAKCTAGIHLVYTYSLADAATADYDIVMEHKVEVLDVVCQKRAANGGAANTVQIKSTGNAISDAISININDTTLARAGTINDANSVIDAGGKLRCSVTKAGGNAAVHVTVVCVRKA